MISRRLVASQARRPASSLIQCLPICRTTPSTIGLRLSPWTKQSRAWETTTTGDQQSGHIYAGANESILFFDNLFPLSLTTFLGKPWQSDKDLSHLLRKFNESSLSALDPINMVKRSIPESLPIKVTEIIPRLKDGGAFVKFTHPPEVQPNEIIETLGRLLEEKPIKPWFSPFRGIQIGLVKGVPWLEDLNRFPKSGLKIEFIPPTPEAEAVELSQETLYSLFRKYGKIAEITQQPSDSKVLPKYANLSFGKVRDAIMARSCLHGVVVSEALGGGKSGTKLRLSYEARQKSHPSWDWLSNHPRIVIPVVAALLAGVTVFIFDPIREFFIKAHIQKSFRLSNYRIFQWFKRQTDDFMAFAKHKRDEATINALYNHRKEAIEDIQTWLMESADTFIVVQGPRGSGKEDLVLKQALDGRNDVLAIDCKPIVEARGESTVIQKLAAEVGYRPVFSWANQLSSLVDLAIQSTTGVKSGFSETSDSQLTKIFENTAAALKAVSLEGRRKTDIDASMSDDVYLEAHPEKRSVVVVHNFLLKNEESSVVYDKISEWAAALVQSNIAHVIFLTSDASYSKSLSKALPDRVFRQVALGDLSSAEAKKYVLSHLNQPSEADEEEARVGNSKKIRKPQQPQTSELDEVIQVLGGRLTDLEFLARRLKTGQTPKQAVGEIIDQSASEILKLFLLPNKHPNALAGTSSGTKYSIQQAWYLIREIAKHESLRYNEVLLSNTFASSLTAGATNGEAVLEDLTNAELITVKSRRGRPQAISAGRPVYQAAFKTLLNDRVLCAKMDLAVMTELAKIEAKTIESVEGELSLLGQMSRQPAETFDRVGYLLAKLADSQVKIRGFEKEMAGFKKILTQEA